MGAVQYGGYSMISTLLSYYSDNINATDSSGYTAMHYLDGTADSDKIVKLLLQYHSSLNTASKTGIIIF